MNDIFPKIIIFLYSPIYGGTVGSVIAMLVCAVIFFFALSMRWRKDDLAGRVISVIMMTSSGGSIIGSLTGLYVTADFFQIVMYIGVALMLSLLWRRGEIITERRRKVR